MTRKRTTHEHYEDEVPPASIFDNNNNGKEQQLGCSLPVCFAARNASQMFEYLEKISDHSYALLKEEFAMYTRNLRRE